MIETRSHRIIGQSNGIHFAVRRRTFLCVLLVGCAMGLGTASSIANAQNNETIDPAQAKVDGDGKTLWYDIQLLPIEGQGWSDTKSDYDRLPAKAESVVRDAVWNLSRHSAGISVRFITDATTIRTR